MKKNAQDDVPASPPAPAFLPPLKPRPKLFFALVLVTALWVAALLVLYFTTVRAERGSRPQLTTDKARDR